MRTRDVGWVEVICGPMFSGKSEELIRRVVRVDIAKRKVQVFKPALDDRYDDREIVSVPASGAVLLRTMGPGLGGYYFLRDARGLPWHVSRAPLDRFRVVEVVRD